MSDSICVEYLLSTCIPGDEWSWEEEFSTLLGLHGPELGKLLASVQQDGMTEPVQIGPDRRIWDGHHQILVAVLLRLKRIPCAYVGEPQKS